MARIQHNSGNKVKVTDFSRSAPAQQKKTGCFTWSWLKVHKIFGGVVTTDEFFAGECTKVENNVATSRKFL